MSSASGRSAAQPPGPLHLRRLAVGARTIADLVDWQAERHERLGDHTVVFGQTRNMPRRRAEVIDGGSLYWIIAGNFAMRQRVLDLQPVIDEEQQPVCRIVYDARLVPVVPWPHRPFQGWRYLKVDEAPPDLAESEADAALPADLAGTLRELGVL